MVPMNWLATYHYSASMVLKTAMCQSVVWSNVGCGDSASRGRAPRESPQRAPGEPPGPPPRTPIDLEHAWTNLLNMCESSVLPAPCVCTPLLEWRAFCTKKKKREQNSYRVLQLQIFPSSVLAYRVYYISCNCMRPYETRGTRDRSITHSLRTKEFEEILDPTPVVFFSKLFFSKLFYEYVSGVLAQPSKWAPICLAAV